MYAVYFKWPTATALLFSASLQKLALSTLPFLTISVNNEIKKYSQIINHENPKNIWLTNLNKKKLFLMT